MFTLSYCYVFLYCTSLLVKHMIYLKFNNFLFLFLVLSTFQEDLPCLHKSIFVGSS